MIRPLLASRLVVPILFFGCVFLCAAGVRSSAAQSSDPTADAGTPATSAAVAQPAADDDGALDLAEPDFTVVNLPTTMRLPLHKGEFRLTHRFNGNLRQGTLGNQASSLFGLDDGAVVGFEFRYALARHLEVVAYRSSFDRTIQFSGKYDAIHQSDVIPFSVSGLVSVEGSNNFKQQYAPALGAVVAREIQSRVALYASPIWVHNTAAAFGVDRDTFVLGLGGRIRIMSTTYVVAEVSPRMVGYAPGQAEYAFGIEKRVGGHVFQLNFGNDQGTTFGQIAAGGTPQGLYLGFNLTRKFF
jgi:hypothetical protein